MSSPLERTLHLTETPTPHQDDNGLLLSHRAFWGLPPRGQDRDVASPLPARTITEMCYMPPDLPDGCYLLDLQVRVAPLAHTSTSRRCYTICSQLPFVHPTSLFVVVR